MKKEQRKALHRQLEGEKAEADMEREKVDGYTPSRYQ
jgi:hypothetical protein